MSPQGVHIRVTDILAQPLSGGLYALKNTDNLVRYARSEDGVIHFPETTPGMYSMHEVMPPRGYYRQPRVRHMLIPHNGLFRVEGFDPTEFVLTNSPMFGTSFIIQIEQKPDVMTSMAYGLFIESSGYQMSRAIPDAYGRLSFESIEPGQYNIRPEHTRARPGYGAESALYISVDGVAYAIPGFLPTPRMMVVESTKVQLLGPEPEDDPADKIDPITLQRNFLSFRQKFFSSVQVAQKKSPFLVGKEHPAPCSRKREKKVRLESPLVSNLVDDLLRGRESTQLGSFVAYNESGE